MKTNLILIAVITLVGIGLLTAFKQSEGSKKYLTMTVSISQIVVVDENNKKESIATCEKEYGALLQQINLEMNNISRRGFQLVNSSQIQMNGGYNPTIYVFEK
ncbi:MAG: hypothetical protein JHD28_01310 [Bacteroidia bacterium]|nr:hypothetical protein [Bacteroidia bacterium]